jgi:hypothetical protein
VADGRDLVDDGPAREGGGSEGAVSIRPKRREAPGRADGGGIVSLHLQYVSQVVAISQGGQKKTRKASSIYTCKEGGELNNGRGRRMMGSNNPSASLNRGQLCMCMRYNHLTMEY